MRFECNRPAGICRQKLSLLYLPPRGLSTEPFQNAGDKALWLGLVERWQALETRKEPTARERQIPVHSEDDLRSKIEWGEG